MTEFHVLGGDATPVETPRSHCPFCGAVLDTTTAVAQSEDESCDPERIGTAPRSGDATICMFCARPSIFGVDLQLRRPNAEEMRLLQSDPTVRQVIDRTKRFGHRRPGYQGEDYPSPVSQRNVLLDQIRRIGADRPAGSEEQ